MTQPVKTSDQLNIAVAELGPAQLYLVIFIIIIEEGKLVFCILLFNRLLRKPKANSV